VATNHIYGHSKKKQELSYRKQIVRQLRTQFVYGISIRDLEIYVKGHSRSLETEPLDRSYTRRVNWTLNIIVTLKYGSEVTQGH